MRGTVKQAKHFTRAARKTTFAPFRSDPGRVFDNTDEFGSSGCEYGSLEGQNIVEKRLNFLLARTW